MPTPPLDQLKRALVIAEQIQTLEEEYASIIGGQITVAPTLESGTGTGNPKRRGGKRTFSAESRAKMAAAQKARWAKKSGKQR